MGKKGKRHNQGGHKKSKNRRESEETAVDNVVQAEGMKKCGHVVKAAKLGVLQNYIPHLKLRECSSCEKGQNGDSGICLCLRCGKQGCDRYSEDRHALSHYESLPSHNLTVNLHSMMVWCYSCDMEIPVQPNTDLHECIKLLLKALKMNAPNDHMPSMSSISHAESIKKSEALNLKHASNANKIKGLVNLGNTCFFNSVMQNLFQTELLHVAMAFVNQADYSQTIITKNDLPTLSVQVTTPPGSLITALTKLLDEYRSSSPGPLNPKFLFSEICKKAPRFRGFQQQDSQELLRYLLDSVKTEQLRRIKLGVLKVFEIAEGTEVKSLPEKKKEKLKEYVGQVTAPSVDSVFAGRLDSIVVCHECHKESRVTESFLDLSLSLAVPQPLKGRIKTPSVSQRNKKNTSHSAYQDDSVEGESSAKPQTPSKHQKKVAAREARKKKGKKGKRRTVSHSASDDGKQETKQPQENLEAGSDGSDHEEHEETTEDVATDQKNSGDSNMESRAKDSGVETVAKDYGEEEEKATKNKRVENVTKVTGEDEARDNEKTEVAKNSGMEVKNMEDPGTQKESTKDSDIDFSVEKDSGIDVSVEKDSGIEETNAKDSGIDVSVEKDSGIEETNAKDSGIDETVAEHSGIVTAKDSEEESHQSIVGDLEEIPSECVTNSGFELKGGTGEEMEVTVETDAEKTFSEQQIANESNYSTSVLIEETKPVTLKFEGLSDPLHNTDFHAKKDKDLEDCGKFDLSGKNSDGKEDLAKSENQPNESGHNQNISQKKREETPEFVSLTRIDKESEINGKEPRNSNKEGKTLQDEIALHISCESCGTKDQTCELNCGCLRNEKKTGGTEGAEAEEEIVNNVISGLKKLEITDKENISEENTKELDLKNVEYDEQLSKMSSEHKKQNTEEKVTLSGDNFLEEDNKELDQKNAENNEQHSEMSPELKQNVEEKVVAFGEDNNILPKVHTLRPCYSSLPGECSVQSCLSRFCSPEILEGKNKFACEECSKRKDDKDSGERDNKDEASSTDDDDDDTIPKGATASKPKTKKDAQRSVVYTEATKQLLLTYTPPVLTLHFKRFQQVGFGLRKVPKHVDFPLVLDLAPFCRSNGEISSDSKHQVLYSLIGVVEHSGGLNSGHYTACVKLKSSPTYAHFTDLSSIKDFASFIERMWKKNQGVSYTHAQPRDGQWYHVSDSRVTVVTEARVLKSQAYMLFYERLPFRINNVDN